MKQLSKMCRIFLICLLLSGCGSESQMLLDTSATEVFGETEDGTQAQSGTARTIAVYVCGEVNHPGVYELTEGMRICDAVEAAGGFTENAGREYWNLAEVLTDGQMLSVPTREEEKKRKASAEAEQTSGGTGQQTEGLVDINTADVTLLTSIPGIGQVRAEAVIAYREEHGRFEKTEDIKKVSGIGDALFAKMKDYITVS